MAFWKNNRRGGPPPEPPKSSRQKQLDFSNTAELPPVAYDDDDDPDDEKTQLLPDAPRPSIPGMQRVQSPSSRMSRAPSPGRNAPRQPASDFDDFPQAAAGRAPLRSRPSATPPPIPRKQPESLAQKLDGERDELFDDDWAEADTLAPQPLSQIPQLAPLLSPQFSDEKTDVISRRPASPRPSPGMQSGSRSPAADMGPGASPEERARNIRLLILDVDGTLTDGGLYCGPQGEVFKRFSVRDGHGIMLARRAGLETAFLTARTSQIVEARARELGIALVFQGRKDKLQGLSEVLSAAGLEALSAAYMGDDLIDLSAMVRCGLSGCPADACPEVRGRAHFVAGSPGGSGAVREFIEMILKAQGKWEALAEGFPMR